MPSGAGARPFFPPLERVQIERVACTDPAAYGLHLARWDCRSLQQVVVERAVVGSIHYTTVARILATASLQPHRSRYRKTATIDERFVTQAAKIWWRYERVEWLYDRGKVVLCWMRNPPCRGWCGECPCSRCAAGRSLAASSKTNVMGP